MATTTLSELREMGDEQLELTLKETCENLFRLRLQSQTERLDAPSELRKNRRHIAQIKTLLRERELVRYFTVEARFLHKSNNRAVTGSEYRARVFDEDVFVDDPLGDDHLDSEGRMKLTCDVENATKRDSFLSFFEGKPDVYVVLQMGSEEVFRSATVKYDRRKSRKRTLNLGTFKV